MRLTTNANVAKLIGTFLMAVISADGRRVALNRLLSLGRVA